MILFCSFQYAIFCLLLFTKDCGNSWIAFSTFILFNLCGCFWLDFLLRKIDDGKLDMFQGLYMTTFDATALLTIFGMIHYELFTELYLRAYETHLETLAIDNIFENGLWLIWIALPIVFLFIYWFIGQPGSKPKHAWILVFVMSQVRMFSMNYDYFSIFMI